MTRSSASGGYSGTVRRVLVFSAFVICLLPLPVTYFRLIPSYTEHARFLILYAPFLSLLTLAYLFYVRDALGRAMFADVLDPPPPPDLYYREPRSHWFRRRLRGVKSVILTVLPALLVFVSMFCISRYLGVLHISVTAASELYAARQERDSALIKGKGKKSAARSPGAAGLSGRKSSLQSPAATDSLPEASDTAAVRQHVLRTATIDAIPEVVKLTGLYMASFLALLIAVSLMALKEYAKEALGLSEHQLVFGRYYRSPGDE